MHQAWVVDMDVYTLFVARQAPASLIDYWDMEQ